MVKEISAFRGAEKIILIAERGRRGHRAAAPGESHHSIPAEEDPGVAWGRYYTRAAYAAGAAQAFLVDFMSTATHFSDDEPWFPPSEAQAAASWHVRYRRLPQPGLPRDARLRSATAKSVIWTRWRLVPVKNVSAEGPQWSPRSRWTPYYHR